ncbi:MAG: copper resistance protein CopC/CopD [Ilumatobacteraceae bacterium]|nr:copper resistance protein CopC/CopD [Ilumatobacteraceae bacterium]
MFLRRTPVIKRFLLSFAGSLGLVIFLLSGPVLAHNSLATTTPSDGSTLDVSPTSWVLTFTKEVPLASATAEIVAADGVRTSLQTPTHGASTNIISFPLLSNLTGSVTARWRLVGVDGHVISGRVGFSVLAESSSSLVPTQTVPTASPPTIQVSPANIDDGFIAPIPELPRQTLRFLNYGALLVLVGLMFVEFDIARGVLGFALAQRTMRVASIGLAASATLQMLIFTADITGKTLFASLGSIGATMETTPGSMLILKVVISCIIGFIAFRRRSAHASPSSAWWIPALLLQYFITLAYTGHSRSQRWPIIGIPADVIHTAAAGVWLGGLLVLLWIVVPRVSDGEAIQVLQRFGTAAKTAVIALVVTGLFQTLRLHDNPWSIFTTVHGQLLLVKLFLFAAMLRYADMNRQSLDRLFVGEANIVRIKRQVIRTSLIETICGLAVVAVTAVLVSSSLGT